MSLKIGFAIITYNDPERLFRLVKTLNAAFRCPPIVCHHDFGQCFFDVSPFPSNVQFVRPHLSTGWCHINTSLSVLKALRLLRDNCRPDWFVMLSGSDYPVRKADEVLAELSAADYDAYLDNRQIQYGGRLDTGTAEHGYSRPNWIPLAYDRYCAFRFSALSPTRSILKGKFALHKRDFHIRNPYLISWVSKRSFKVYAGAFWFQANHRAVDRLLDDASVPAMVQYFGERPVPEEALFHTILCNQPDLRICSDHKRYENWENGGSHPKWLEVSDLPKIAESGAHFARKVRSDGVVQDAIDQTLLGI